MLGFRKFAAIKGAMISGKNNNITYAKIGGAWRPTTTTSNIVAKAHWLLTITTTWETL
jgi:hypothetical protein